MLTFRYVLSDVDYIAKARYHTESAGFRAKTQLNTEVALCLHKRQAAYLRTGIYSSLKLQALINNLEIRVAADVGI